MRTKAISASPAALRSVRRLSPTVIVKASPRVGILRARSCGDRLDPAGRVFEPLFAEADLAPDGELVVEMAVAQALEPGDFRGDAGLAHEPFVAGGDRLGEGELVRLRSCVLDPADGAVAGHGRVDEAGFAFEDLPSRGVDAALGRVGVELDLVVLVALALDPALALLDLRGQPRHVEMVQGFEAPLGVDAGAHGLGRADEDPDLAAIDRVEQALFRRGLLVVLHEGDLSRWHAAGDKGVLDPAIGGEAAGFFGGQRAEIGKDHLRRAGESVGNAVGAGVAIVRCLFPDAMNVVDQGVELVVGLVVASRLDKAEVDRGMAAVGDDRKQDVVTLLRLPLTFFDRLDPLGEMALIGEEGLARRRGDDLPTPSRDRRQLQILAEVGLEDDVGRHPIDRHQIGDIDELAESRDRLVEAGRLKLELGPRFPEIGRPGVELLDAALL